MQKERRTTNQCEGETPEGFHAFTPLPLPWSLGVRSPEATAAPRQIQKNAGGFSLIEAMLASSVFTLLVTAFVGAYLYGQEAMELAGNRAHATFYAEEGLEAIRNIRDAGFANLPDGTHGLAVSGDQWILSGSSDTNDIFTRQIVISTVDAKRKSVTANATWQQNAQRTGFVSLATRFTNWMASVAGNWANPTQEASLNISGDQNGVKIQTQSNYAYMIRNGSSPNFFVIDVNNPDSPVTVGSLALSGTPTNIAVSGNYAYVSNTSDTQELQIINVSTPSAPSIAGTYDAPSAANANGVYASGTTAYLTRASSSENEFIIVNATIPASPTLVGSLNLNADGNEVVATGNYAYVASSHNSQELQVLNITVPASPTLAGSLNLSGNTNAVTVALTGTTALVGQGSVFYTVNISAPTSPAVLGSINTQDTLNDIALNLGNADTYVFIATSDNNAEFQVVDIFTLSSPLILGSVNVATKSDMFGMAYNLTLDRAFGASASDDEEFILFAPQ